MTNQEIISGLKGLTSFLAIEGVASDSQIDYVTAAISKLEEGEYRVCGHPKGTVCHCYDDPKKDKLYGFLNAMGGKYEVYLQKSPEKEEFIECDTCRAKPGSPTLCKGCLHNRGTISRLTEKEELLDSVYERLPPDQKSSPNELPIEELEFKNWMGSEDRDYEIKKKVNEIINKLSKDK